MHTQPENRMTVIVLMVAEA